MSYIERYKNNYTKVENKKGKLFLILKEQILSNKKETHSIYIEEYKVLTKSKI